VIAPASELWVFNELSDVTSNTPVKRNNRRAPMRAQTLFETFCPFEE
jgi:hypothetical protein